MSKQSNSSGVSLLGLLGILFIALKLTGVISWSWWWVLLPFYSGLIILIAILITWLIYGAVKYKMTGKSNHKIVEKIKKPNRFQEKMTEMMAQAERQKSKNQK